MRGIRDVERWNEVKRGSPGIAGIPKCGLKVL